MMLLFKILLTICSVCVVIVFVGTIIVLVAELYRLFKDWGGWD